MNVSKPLVFIRLFHLRDNLKLVSLSDRICNLQICSPLRNSTVETDYGCGSLLIFISTITAHFISRVAAVFGSKSFYLPNGMVLVAGCCQNCLFSSDSVDYVIFDCAAVFVIRGEIFQISNRCLRICKHSNFLVKEH